MKKLTVLVMMVFLAAAFVQGQAVKRGKVTLKKMTGNAVSADVRGRFQEDFGNIPNVKWFRSSYFDEASFVKDGKKTTAFYDPDGQLVGTTTIIKFSDLPAVAQSKIKEEYKDYKVENVIFFDDNEDNSTDMYIYDHQFDSADNYFVEMSSASRKIVLQVDPKGQIYLFAELK